MKLHFIILFFLIMFSTNVFAQKIFYDTATNKQVVDISGQKTKEQIQKEFGSQDYQELTIDEKQEGYRIKNNKLQKYSIAIEEKTLKDIEDQKKIKKEQDRQKAVEKLKALGLTEDEIRSLSS